MPRIETSCQCQEANEAGGAKSQYELTFEASTNLGDRLIEFGKFSSPLFQIFARVVVVVAVVALLRGAASSRFRLFDFLPQVIATTAEVLVQLDLEDVFARRELIDRRPGQRRVIREIKGSLESLLTSLTC